MTNPNSERDPDPLPDMGEAPPLTSGELAEALSLAEGRLSALDRVIRKSEIDRDAKVQATRERLSSVQALGQAQREAAMVEETARAHREAVAASDAERAARLKELGAILERVNAVAPLFQSPVVVLARDSLGTPERTHLEAQLAGCGPAALRNYAMLAVATRNKRLGAALLAVADRLPRSQRPFSTQDLATRLVGDEWRQISGQITATRNRVQEGVLRNRSFERHTSLNPTSKISLGLARRAEGVSA